ncbi:hypothetical protein [Kitasatospora sp. NPDC088134]|uniref:hypothetical protein n=1 Tax=Kitasatospora sp. NPDC088134 TaxID=3364071 RepID=UPI0037F9BA4C
MTRKTKTYGPRQLARHLGMEEWQRDRALREGLIPGPDPSTARWTAQQADDLAARANAVLAAVGTIPDVGARRAEQYLADRLRPGEQVAPGTVAEAACPSGATTTAPCTAG